MEGRDSTRRRSIRFIVVRRLRWIGILSLVGLVCWLAFPRSHKIEPSGPVSQGKSGASEFNSSSTTNGVPGVPPLIARPSLPVRSVYPYSVIPGGVHSAEELKNAIVNDPVVSAHYATFFLARARIIQLDRNRSMHVAYRFGNQVYWTKRELKLAKGETLITDGVQMARTRCGNLISDTVAGPVAPNEPTIQQLDTPQSPPDTELRVANNMDGVPIAPPNAPPSTQVPGSIMPPVEGVLPPGPGSYPIILGPPGPPGAAPWPVPPAPTHVFPVAEPATVILLLIGLFAVAMLLRRKVRDSRSES